MRNGSREDGFLRNIQMELLRTFVTVADLRGLTKAGDVLGRSQPAISLQIKRLEEFLDCKLLETKGRNLALTEDGQTLVGYARRILALNDEALSRFGHSTVTGAIRVGIPHDFAVAFLQRMLIAFSRDQPDIPLEIHCDVSSHLLAALRQERLDVVVALRDEETQQYLARSWVKRLLWVAAADSDVPLRDPVPLIAHPEGDAYRNRMIHALNKAQRSWQIVFSGPGISGLQNAVLSGLGVSVLTERTLLDGMRVLTTRDGFPALPDIDVGLYCRQARLTKTGQHLLDHLVKCIDDAKEDPVLPKNAPSPGAPAVSAETATPRAEPKAIDLALLPAKS